MSILLLAAPALMALILFLGTHVLLWHVFVSDKGVLLLAKIAGGSYVVVAIGAYFLGIDGEHVWISIPLFSFCTLAYFHLYVGTFRSVSMRILEEIYRVPGHKMALADLERVFPKEFLFTSRLDILEEHRWFHKNGDRYACTSKGALFGKMILRIRTLYGIKNAG
ncbi:hypothetical protein A3D88_03820 [Candidatus Peribacteria bacterium RIFCSPHIGHO2_02_FULL_52_16]|nr:MAG: hypothetical protein A2706_04635 [Candidatus Peribacteria bacterium RIFCSPHIGHO2_01_FULL_51_35]OGJ61808.1 MAG: hypothetical protein A3D88_03820 [Candidatus Peribacteria bacterium RIFCSPHIGHO2_02_FULL_52_16]